MPPVRWTLACVATTVVVGATSQRAAADGWRTAAEAGVEIDSNVQRVATVPGEAPATGAVVRVGASVDRAAASPGRGAYALAASVLARRIVDDAIAGDSAALFAIDGRWLGGLRDGGLRLGPRIAYRDAVSLVTSRGERTFRSLALEGALVLADDTYRLAVSGGARFFGYKPSEAFSWRGPGVSASLQVPLWQARADDVDADAAEDHAIDLLVGVTAEARSYRGMALHNICAPGQPVRIECFAASTRRRDDRVQRLAVVATYTGALVASLEYQLAVFDSNSFGHSTIRNRIRTAVTIGLGAWYLTPAAALQVDLYPDTLLVLRDPERDTLDTLDDENRSSLDLRAARRLFGRWSLELRTSGWMDLTVETRYRRALGYAGLVWASD